MLQSMYWSPFAKEISEEPTKVHVHEPVTQWVLLQKYDLLGWVHTVILGNPYSDECLRPQIFQNIDICFNKKWLSIPQMNWFWVKVEMVENQFTVVWTTVLPIKVWWVAWRKCSTKKNKIPEKVFVMHLNREWKVKCDFTQAWLISMIHQSVV